MAPTIRDVSTHSQRNTLCGRSWFHPPSPPLLPHCLSLPIYATMLPHFCNSVHIRSACVKFSEQNRVLSILTPFSVMSIAINAREWWAVRRQDMAVASTPPPPNTPNAIAQYRAKQCSHDGVKAGAKAAAIACIASAIPVLMGARAIPWARANLNYAAQAHIISLVSGAAYFVVADKTILASARKNSFEKSGPVETLSF